jgi:hypothetical protein
MINTWVLSLITNTKYRAFNHTAIQERTRLGGRGCGRSASIPGKGTSDHRRGTPPPSTGLGSAHRLDKARVSGDLQRREPTQPTVSTCIMINIAR